MISFTVFALAMVGCAKKPSDILGKIQKAANSENPDDMKKYYTKQTILALEEFKKMLPDNKLKPDNRFAEGASWSVVTEKIYTDTASVTITYNNHPDSKMKKTEVFFKMKKEGEDWKLDLEHEINFGIFLLKGKGNRLLDDSNN